MIAPNLSTHNGEKKKKKTLTIVRAVPEINHDVGNGFACVDIDNFKSYQELNSRNVLADIMAY